MGLELIFPIVTNEQLQFIEDNFRCEEKLLRSEIEGRKKNEVYFEDVRDFSFDIKVSSKTSNKSKSDAQFQNQVYERIFRKMDTMFLEDQKE